MSETTLLEGHKTIPKQRHPVVLSQAVIIKLQHQEFLQTKVYCRKIFDGHTGTIIADEHLGKSTELRLSSLVVTVEKDDKLQFLGNNLNHHAITFTKNKQVTVFQLFSPQKQEHFLEIGQESVALDVMKDGEDF